MEKYLPDRRVAVNAHFNSIKKDPLLSEVKEAPQIQELGPSPKAKRHNRERKTAVTIFSPEDHVTSIASYRSEIITTQIDTWMEKNISA